MSQPSAFVAAWLPKVAALCVPPPSTALVARALDLAMGRGRHLELLARAGFHPFGVDRSLEAIRAAVDAARASGIVGRAFCADMTVHPLPTAWFDLILVTRYLDRARMPALEAALAPGGFILYETFTIHQRQLGYGPTSSSHLLEPGELLSLLPLCEPLFYEEVSGPEAVARLVARRRA